MLYPYQHQTYADRCSAAMSNPILIVSLPCTPKSFYCFRGREPRRPRRALPCPVVSRADSSGPLLNSNPETRTPQPPIRSRMIRAQRVASLVELRQLPLRLLLRLRFRAACNPKPYTPETRNPTPCTALKKPSSATR